MIVRRDLPTGFRDAHEIHAAYAIGRMVGPDGPDFPHAIALAARDEAHLRDIAALLSAKGVKYKLIEEPDPPWSGQATALCTVPLPRTIAGRFLSNLPLLRKEKAPA